mmetsp:Transcript_78203/g.123446  ORF Transcript_78203/g.123446 Transcript_78203/m.123446 type:complete len:84 (-) Transcript_78203:209-460(-)
MYVAAIGSESPMQVHPFATLAWYESSSEASVRLSESVLIVVDAKVVLFKLTELRPSSDDESDAIWNALALNDGGKDLFLRARH